MEHTEAAMATQAEGATPAAAAAAPAMPLTERILDALPGPRAAWVVAWALVALARLGALLVILNATGTVVESRESLDTALGQAVFGYVILVAVLGTHILVGRVHGLD